MGQASSHHRNQEDQPFDFATTNPSTTAPTTTTTTTTQPIIHKEELLHHLLLMGSSNSGKTLFAKMSNLILEGSMTSRSMKYREELLSSMFAWLLLIVCVKKKLFSEMKLQEVRSEALIDVLLKKRTKNMDSTLKNVTIHVETRETTDDLDDRCLLQLAIVKPELLWSNDKMMRDIYEMWQTETILHKIYAIIYFNKMSPELLFLFGNTQVGSVISGNVLDKFGNVNTVPKQPQWQHFENFNYVMNHCVEIAHSLRRAQKGILDPEINFDKEFLLASNMTRGYYESEIKLKLENITTKKQEPSPTSSKKKESKENKEELVTMSEQFRSLFMIDSAGVRSDRKKWRKILLSKLYPDLHEKKKKETSTDAGKKKKKDKKEASSSSGNLEGTPSSLPLSSSSTSQSCEISPQIYSQLKPSGVAILYFVSLTSFNQYSVDDILGLYGSTISITVDSKTPGSPLLNINSDKILTVERPIYVSSSEGGENALSAEEDHEEQKLVSVLKSPRGTEVNLKHVDLLEKKRMKKKTLKPPKYKPLIDSASSMFLSRHQSLKHNGLLTLKNQLIDSLEFFNKTVNMPEVTNVPIILVFTKKESLKRKLVFCDFSDSFFTSLQNQTSEMVPLDPLPEEILLKRPVMIGTQKTHISARNSPLPSPSILSLKSMNNSDASPRLMNELKTSKLLLNRLKKELDSDDVDSTRVESPVIEHLVIASTTLETTNAISQSQQTQSTTPSELKPPPLTSEQETWSEKQLEETHDYTPENENHHQQFQETKEDHNKNEENEENQTTSSNDNITRQPSETSLRQSLTRDRLLDVSSVGMAIGERRQLDNRCVSVSINLTTLEQQLELQRKAILELLDDSETIQAMTETCLKFSDPYEKKVPLTEDDFKEPEQPRSVSDEYSQLVIDYIAKQFLNQVKNEEKRKQIEQQIIVLDIFNRDEMEKVLKELIHKTC
ncbi:hypothetical protein C9374_010308 [Naegleria lovaniensis]|uniref:Uncharacterized protein n=1 Tax=Naegleria lovaniensis TaxID=51637 RepID=A0AA88GGM2_NAELO|nr:uncharacterized protein C9374_010308 [Naegleria lovaniensis]KAG2374934.1 hypothetical protein C9374_010308 [Naegleria lovaniensis]